MCCVVDCSIEHPGSHRVRVKVRYDVDCSTEHPVSHVVRMLVKVLYDMELNRPLYYFTVPGIVISGV